MSVMRGREDFIQRTKEIFEDSYRDFEPKDREVTFLMNCLLGLIVTVSEIEKTEGNKVLDDNIDDEFLALIPKTMGFVDKKNAVDEKSDLIKKKTVTNLNIQVGHWEDLRREKKSWLLDNIRNGIAHLNIEWENDNEKITAIRLWNKPFGKKYAKKKNFEITFEIEILKTFAITISNKYLTEKNQKKQDN